MFHCGSRGFGHQVATDYLANLSQGGGASMVSKNSRSRISAFESSSPEGQAYFCGDEAQHQYVLCQSSLFLHCIHEVAQFSTHGQRSWDADGL